MALTVNRLPGKATVFSVPVGQETMSTKEAARYLQVGYAELMEAHCHPGDIASNYGSTPYACEAFMRKVQAAADGSYVFTDDAYTYIPSAVCVRDGWIPLEEALPIAAGEIATGEESVVAPTATAR